MLRKEDQRQLKVRKVLLISLKKLSEIVILSKGTVKYPPRYMM